jgi:hypothetical protein
MYKTTNIVLGYPLNGLITMYKTGNILLEQAYYNV